MWEKNKDFKSITDVVQYHTGMLSEEFLNPPKDPHIKNLRDAVILTQTFLKKGLHVAIIADYDVDGILAAINLYEGLKEYIKQAGLTNKLIVRFPKRFSEGYGLSSRIIDEIPCGYFIITVDNGIAALEQIAQAKRKGIPVIVTDHHLCSDTSLPNADIIVDPNAIGGSEFAGYCGAAIAYRFAKTLIPKNKKLLEQLLALTAIATITDVMPLYGDNRNIVKRGLKLLNQRKVPYGMNVLLNLLRIEYIQEDDIGFKIGPVLNAAGRLEDNGAEKVFNLLKMKEPDNPMLENDQKAYTAALELIELNKKRQNIVKESMNKIQENYPDDVLANERCIVLYDSSFNEGIIGILAGKLTEKYNVPAFVFTDPIYPKKIGLYKGSGRSARNIHLKNLLDKNKDLLSGYGGHAVAAGLSIDKTKLSQFSQQVNLQLSDIVLSERRCLKYDLEISASEIPYYMDELQKFAPYGEGNPNPVFLIHDFYLSPRNGHFFQRIGQNAEHIKLYGNNMDAIGFDMAERFINNEVPKQIDIIGTLSFNYFNNRKKIQIEIFDYLSIKKEKTPFMESLESLLTL